MIVLNDYEKKLVIPRWLSFAKAAKSRELAFPRKTPFILNELTEKRFADDCADFQSSPTAHKAADLMGAALVMGKDPLAKELARYVKSRPDLRKPAHDLASHILGEARQSSPTQSVQTRIAQNKTFLLEFPQNAFAWIERARLYTLVGQFDKAERCVRIAVNLAPEDRYIIRSGTRFFLHANKIEEGWHYLKRASHIQFDPWIKATEVSVAEVLQKGVKKLKWPVPNQATPDDIYHFSELIESYGMLELLNGNDHRAKKCFKLAWSNPSTNVVTHSEWIVREHFPALAELAKANFGESHEARAWQNFHNMKVEEALTAAREWALEEPYARNAFNLASFLAFHKRNYGSGISIALDGLRATPNDFGLRNNLCFGLLKQNKVVEAELEFAKIPQPKNELSDVVYCATKGLLEFKRGRIALGRSLYQEAMGKARDSGNSRLHARVALNLALAEVESHTDEANEQVTGALNLAEKMDAPDVLLTRQLLEGSFQPQTKQQLPFKEFHKPTIPPVL